MKCYQSVLIAFLLFSSYPVDLLHASALQQPAGRLVYLTLIPNFENNSIQFDGRSELYASSDPLDLSGLPLHVEIDWKDPNNPTWNIRGSVQGGSVEYDAEQQIYHLLIGPISLQPYDKLNLILPFVNLDYAQIQPPPDPPDSAEERSRQRTNRFSYSGGDAGREIQKIDIPFTTITKIIDLSLTPLMGETLLGETLMEGMSGFRLLGRVAFDSIDDYDEFIRHCQSASNQFRYGDYRSAHLLYSLDHPHYFGPDVLNPVYQSKPTIIYLRSELRACHYDQEQKIGQVEAVFSGRTSSFDPDPTFFPEELRKSDVMDGNFSFAPMLFFKDIQGYGIQFGKIVLAPEDTLTITVPYTHIQIESIYPSPDIMNYQSGQAGAETQIVYRGPAAFELYLPYVPQSGLYLIQAPALFRPSVSLLETNFGGLFPLKGSQLTWIMLGTGLLLLVLSRITVRRDWLAIFGWLLISISLFYGMRGAFGLLYVAIALYLFPVDYSPWSVKSGEDRIRKLTRGLIGFMLISIAIYFDHLGSRSFRGLPAADLSPLTPVILLILIGALFPLLYSWPKDAKSFKSSDLPTLVLFLAVLSLYDVFDKSLLSVLLLFMGILYVTERALRNNSNKKTKNSLGKNLQARFKLAFGTRVIPVSMIVSILFTVANDLSQPYGNAIQILSPALSDITAALLSFVSVFLTFAAIAMLFVLVYPFMPSNTGYMKAILFALFLFLVFLFGIGTDDRLIDSLPSILLGRVIYYFNVPLLIGIYFDIHEFMQRENQRLAREGKDKEGVSFQTASSIYLRNLQGTVGTLAGIFSLIAPSVYAFVSNGSVIFTYLDLLQKLLPVLDNTP